MNQGHQAPRRTHAHRILAVALVTLITAALNHPATARAQGQQQDPCAYATAKDIDRHMPIRGYGILSKTQVHPQVCQVVISYEDTYMPLYVNKDYVIIGDYFSNGSHPTVQAIAAERAKGFTKDKQTLEKNVALRYKPKNATTHIYFITDPDCPACNTAKKGVKKFADENSVEIRVIFYPLPMHPKAKDKASAAICANLTYEEYMKDKYPPSTCKKGLDKVNASIEALEKMGVEGAPAFISATGTKTIGFDPEELKALQ